MPRPSCTRALAERADQLRLVRQRRPGGVHHRQHGSLALSYASESLPHAPAPRLPCSAFCFSPAACRIFVCVRYSPSGYRESLLPVFTAPLHAAYSLPFEHCYALLPPPSASCSNHTNTARDGQHRQDHRPNPFGECLRWYLLCCSPHYRRLVCTQVSQHKCALTETRILDTHF